MNNPSLGSAGPWTEKIPKDETEHWQHDDQDSPQNLSAGVGAALEDVHDRPDIGDQDDQTPYTSIFHHPYPFLMLSGPELHGLPRGYTQSR